MSAIENPCELKYMVMKLPSANSKCKMKHLQLNEEKCASGGK